MLSWNVTCAQQQNTMQVSQSYQDAGQAERESLDFKKRLTAEYEQAYASHPQKDRPHQTETWKEWRKETGVQSAKQSFSWKSTRVLQCPVQRVQRMHSGESFQARSQLSVMAVALVVTSTARRVAVGAPVVTFTSMHRRFAS